MTIITDGEQRRESYSNRFATALDGIDDRNPGTTLYRNGKPIAVPRVVGPIRRKSAVLVRDLKVLRANTDRPVKIDAARPVHHEQTGAGRITIATRRPWRSTLPPRSMPKSAICSPPAPISSSSTSRGCSSIPTTRGVTGSPRSTARSTASPARSRCICVSAMPLWCTASRPVTRSCRNWKTPRRAQISIEAAQPRLDLQILEKLPTKTIVLGVNDLADLNAETPDLVAARIRAALAYVPAERLAVAPDCGMKYLPREIAFAKMKALADGAAIVRREIGGG